MSTEIEYANHAFINNDPSQFDSDCAICGGKQRDAIHHAKERRRIAFQGKEYELYKSQSPADDPPPTRAAERPVDEDYKPVHTPIYTQADMDALLRQKRELVEALKRLIDCQSETVPTAFFMRYDKAVQRARTALNAAVGEGEGQGER